MSRNNLQGSWPQSPQLLNLLLLTEQSYKGQTLEGIISFAQKVDPLTLTHPVHVLLKNSHSSHFNPQTDSAIGKSFLQDNICL